MTWLTAKEYLFNTWQRICPFSYGHCIVHIHLYVIIYYSFEHECPNKNVNIYIFAHNTFLWQSLSGRLTVKHWKAKQFKAMRANNPYGLSQWTSIVQDSVLSLLITKSKLIFLCCTVTPTSSNATYMCLDSRKCILFFFQFSDARCTKYIWRKLRRRTQLFTKGINNIKHHASYYY